MSPGGRFPPVQQPKSTEEDVGGAGTNGQWSARADASATAVLKFTQIWRFSNSLRFGEQVGARGPAFAVSGLVKQADSLKSWLPRVSPKRGRGKRHTPRRGLPARVAGKFTDFERTNLSTDGGVLVVQHFDTWKSHARDQYASGWLFYLGLGWQVSRQQGPKPHLPRTLQLLTMSRLVRFFTPIRHLDTSWRRSSMHYDPHRLSWPCEPGSYRPNPMQLLCCSSENQTEPPSAFLSVPDSQEFGPSEQHPPWNVLGLFHG